MKIFPAIDLYEGKAVRLYKGDYSQMTVYSERPLEVAQGFRAQGAGYLHVVDLEGAKYGTTPNLETVSLLAKQSGLSVQVGGGIRSAETVKKYIDSGVARVILGTAAVTDPDFLADMVRGYGKKIAVGVDIRDGLVAIKGWTETTELTCFYFFEQLERIGVKTVICTDISKDGVLGGTNVELYRELSARFAMDVIASGGVSSLQDVRALADMNLYGAILGKALYTGNIHLAEAIEAARSQSV
ncbi:MAG: 1-(5-phosphoribosyl)-5-[(5-phosphoribosylamino)methylideneamino]imidazole-4-carboxamide isomerase [Oscillospiraceae bacterium]|nr:1-(5-phosphoribosyl)-5-[(5-phosphoribosylamino)methylideneamino]imidazole-4-carboxamide isomerase [Oscillospiraceae bacterium]